jgi:hypothetical protein
LRYLTAAIVMTGKTWSKAAGNRVLIFAIVKVAARSGRQKSGQRDQDCENLREDHNPKQSRSDRIGKAN